MIYPNKELLSFGQFDFDPGAPAPGCLIERIRSSGDQPYWSAEIARGLYL